MHISTFRNGILVTFTIATLTGVAAAQSSSRAVPMVQGSSSRVVPQSVPIQQGSGSRIIRGTPVQGVPMQGSTTRVLPGTLTQGQVIQGQPVQGEMIMDQGRSIRAMPAQQGSATRMTQPVPAQTFESKLWGYLVRSKYRNWAPVPGQSDAMYEGQNPHGAFLKMYLNRKAAGSPKNLPNGSIIIKENFTPAKTLAAVTVMYKTTGYNPTAGDWYWVKYNPDGSVATKQTDKGMVRLGGRVGGCIDCHGGADGDDYAFFND